MRRIHILCGKYQDRLQKPHLRTLAKCLQSFGFEKLAISLNSQVNGREGGGVPSPLNCRAKRSAMIPPWTTQQCFPLKWGRDFNHLFFSFQKVESDNEKLAKYAVGTGAARFQLQYMGHYLFRDERSDPDPRVRNFIPDTWQVMMCKSYFKRQDTSSSLHPCQHLHWPQCPSRIVRNHCT